MIKYKIDHKESLALAKKHLNFDCRRQDVYLLYSRLRCLKKIFSKHLECYKATESSFASESPYNVLSDNEFHKAVVKSISRLQKTCCKKFEKLKQKQQEERDEFDRTCDVEKSQIEKQFRMESAVIRSCLHTSLLMRKNKLQILENKYAKKLEEHKCQMEIGRKKIEEEHIDERNKMVETETHWVDTLTSWLQVELLNKKILDKAKQSQNSLPVTEHFHGLGIDTTVCDHLPKESRGKVLHNVSGTGGGISEIPGSVSCEAIICSNAVEKCSLQTRQNGETAALDTMSSQGPSVTEFADHNRINSSNGIEGNLTSEDPFYVRKEPEEVLLGNPDKEVSTEGPNSRCSVSAVGVVSVRLPTSKERISHSDKEVPHNLTEAVGLIEGSHRVLTVPLLSSAEGGGNGATRNPGSGVPCGTCSTGNSDSFVDAYTNPETSPFGMNLPISEVDRLPQTVNLVDVRENISATQSASQELIPNKSMVSTSEIEISSRMNTSASCEPLEVDFSNSRNDVEDLTEPVSPCVVEDTIGNTDPDVHFGELSVHLSPPELSVTPTAQGNGSLLFNQVSS